MSTVQEINAYIKISISRSSACTFPEVKDLNHARLKVKGFSPDVK